MFSHEFNISVMSPWYASHSPKSDGFPEFVLPHKRIGVTSPIRTPYGETVDWSRRYQSYIPLYFPFDMQFKLSLTAFAGVV